jgi:hypothetical protein
VEHHERRRIARGRARLDEPDPGTSCRDVPGQHRGGMYHEAEFGRRGSRPATISLSAPGACRDLDNRDLSFAYSIRLGSTISFRAICMRRSRLRYDIVCHGIDLTARTQVHYGKGQKKRDRWIDRDLLFGIQSLASDLRRRFPSVTRWNCQAVSPSESGQSEAPSEVLRTKTRTLGEGRARESFDFVTSVVFQTRLSKSGQGER